MIEGVPETSKRLYISLGAILGLCIGSFMIGGTFIGLLGLDGKITEEVGGLRKDFETWKTEQYYPNLNEVNEDVDELRIKLDERN